MLTYGWTGMSTRELISCFSFPIALLSSHPRNPREGHLKSFSKKRTSLVINFALTDDSMRKLCQISTMYKIVHVLTSCDTRYISINMIAVLRFPRKNRANKSTPFFLSDFSKITKLIKTFGILTATVGTIFPMRFCALTGK